MNTFCKNGGRLGHDCALFFYPGYHILFQMADRQTLSFGRQSSKTFSFRFGKETLLLNGFKFSGIGKYSEPTISWLCLCLLQRPPVGTSQVIPFSFHWLLPSQLLCFLFVCFCFFSGPQYPGSFCWSPMALPGNSLGQDLIGFKPALFPKRSSTNSWSAGHLI